MTQQSSQPSDQARLSRDSVHAVLRAARFGIHAYPSPVGELIDRELRAYVHGGRQLPPDAMPERLLAILLQDRKHGATAADAMLPARYKKGTPLHWEYSARLADPAEE